MADRLSILNDPPKVLEGPQLLHKLIRWDENNSTCALDFTSGNTRQRYTYGEIRSLVEALVLRIEDSLSATSPGTDQSSRQHIVPIFLPQSPSLYISQLAILHSGGAFCPINLDAPQERIRFVVGDVSASLLITTSEFKDVVSWENGPMVILVDEFPVNQNQKIPNSRITRDSTPEDMAYVMYTSGSSGTPKGVAVSHLAVSQSLLAHERHIPRFNRFLQFAAPSFDVSVFEIFFPLIRGCTVVGCNRSQLLNDLPGMLIELKVDSAELTPTVVGSLLQKRSNAPGLKLLLTIGELLTTPIVEEFGGSESKPCMLYGMYGPTEAAIHCIIYPEMATSTKPGNIGIPFDTVSTFIAAASTGSEDAADLKFLPIGELGELVLGGPQLAQGYLNREDQNKAAFVSFEGRIYYRTGDKARQLKDGTIEILGRMSSGQVKLRGQRVELGEIEEAIYKHPGVKRVSVVVLGSILIAFILVGHKKPSADDVIKTCAAWLPKFMIPSEIILLQSFPYLPSGKVDKKKLVADYQLQRNENEGENTATMSETARTTSSLLKELLGPFPANMRLAAVGLDSLVAIRVASRLRGLEFNVSAVAILKCDTLSALIRLCDNSSSDFLQTPGSTKRIISESVATILNGNAKDVQSTLSCTPLQYAMLAETALDQKAYRNWVEIELSDITDVPHVISTLHSLAESNSILRTGFTESPDSDGYAQVIWQNLQDSQIEEVTEFSYDFDSSKDASSHRPLRIQVLPSFPNIKLLIYIHHALYDAWSLELLLDDLDTLLLGKPLPERPPFSDVVHAYADGTLKHDDWASRDYWKDHLSQLDIRKLPNFHSRGTPSPGLSITRLSTSISTSDVEAAARRLSTSPQSLFQAAYALILGSYLGSTDFCFGTVFSGRTLPIAGIEDVVGPCLSTLPVRVDLSLCTDIRDLVEQLNTTNRKHLEFCTVPLRHIKSAAGVNPRQLLFDTLFIWQQTLHKYDYTREHVSLVDTVDNLEFNLTLEIIPSSKNIEMKANFQRSMFPELQIQSLLRQVKQIVQVIVEDESTPLEGVFGKLSNDVLSIENESPELVLKGESLSYPVEKIAVEDPERTAIEFAERINEDRPEVHRMSYSNLNTKANQMGHFLLEKNVLPDELVCICMEKSTDLYASILATAKIGAGYLPVAPDVPQERLEHILQEAGVKVVMAQSASRPLLKYFRSLNVVYVDEVNFLKLPSENIPRRYFPANVSYCVFTSGSTGTPKGVLVTQSNLLSNLDVLEDLYPASKNSRFLQSCSQAFDVSVFEIFFAWRVGGCLCSATKDVLFRDLENAIRVLGVTHLSLTPTVAALVDPGNVPKVEFLVTAGEAVTQKVFNAWADKGLWQGYGPSETTNICTVNPKVTRNDSINNVGPPFRNTSAFVLSEGREFEIVPRGGEGEFCFGGSQVFRGYMDPRQEVGRIIDHPTYGRLYRSGDFGRLMPDGSLAFTGRKDDQVKIRGQRVELGEITNVILKSDEVKDCLTMVISNEDGNSQHLVSFWTSGLNNSDILECVDTDSSIINKLFKVAELALPAYMVPTSLIQVSLLPSTTQGKIDKRSLINLFHNLDIHHLNLNSQTTKSSNHTWTPLQLEIAKTVAQIAQLPPSDVSPDTSFFSLGIDSISAISFSRALRQNLVHEVQISDIVKYPSVVRLAEKFEYQNQDVGIKDVLLVKEIDFGFDRNFLESTTDRFEKAGRFVQAILPCTPLQEAMLSAAESSSQKLYDNHVTLNLKGDIENIKACWREMVKRHEILRTCFVSTDMSRYAYAQVILTDYKLDFCEITSKAEVRKPSELEFTPQYTLDLLQVDGFTKLLISMHHALYDGVALSVLYEEVESLYHEKPLPLSVSFTPFLQTMASLNIELADKFWSTTLQDCVPSRFKEVAKSKQEPRQSLTRIQRINVKISLKSVEHSTKKNSTSLLAVLHTVWASILSEQLHQTDICFGNVVSGRTVPIEGIERLVAPCFNTIPTRVANIHNLTYLEAFRKLQTLNADSLPFQSTPLRRIQSKFSPDGSRLFDTLFILQQPPRELDSSIWSIAEDDGAMDFPLVCEVVPKQSDDTLEIILHSYTSMFSADEALALLYSFEERIRLALQNPRRQILPATVREEIIAEMEKKEMAKLHVTRSEQLSTAMSANEEKVRDVISSFTDVPIPKIGRDISVFRLGLDSISSVQVAARLRKQGHNVVASDILEQPTIAKLSSFLAQKAHSKTNEVKEFDFDAFDRQHQESVCAKNGLDAKQVEAIRPCTAVQKGMLAQTLHSGGQEYVNSMWLELLPGISVSSLKVGWETVCNEHEMLRTGFASSDDPKHSFVMVIYAKEHFCLPWQEEIDENSHPAMTLETLLEKPWSLTLRNDNGRSIVIFTAHHALYDAQSIQMILSDVAKSITSHSVTSRPSITSLLGAILNQAKENTEGQKAFWEKDENKIVANRFPDLTPLQVSDRSSEVREIISQLPITELEELCRHNGVTMQAAAQATWARLLTAYIGESSTTFGMTLSGRSVNENADHISFPSIVTLPVRCEIVGTNSELLSRTMNSNASLHKFQFTPLTSIQKWAGFPEGKIFDTLFAYQKLPEGADQAEPPWRIVKEEASVDYAVSLEAQPSVSGKLALRLTFRVDLVPVEHAGLLLKQYDALLQDTLRNPENLCSIAPKLNDELLSITAAKEYEIEGPVTLVHEYVGLGAQQWPDKIALEFATSLEPGNVRSTSWTYQELNEESNKVAQLLCKRQVSPGQIIAICFDKCAEASFAIIGILKAGCAYVALDPNAPAERLKFIIEDSAAIMVFSAGRPAQMLQDVSDKDVIMLDSPGILAGCSPKPPRLSRAIIPQDVAYCLYTSGTTGTPKGCLITHDNTVHFLRAFQRLFAGHWTNDSKYLQFASFHFDVSVMEQFFSWSIGICVASAPRDVIFEDITGAIQQLGITHIDLTPSLARLVHPDDVPSLCKGAFITGGEQLKQEILDVWGEHAVIYNGYGPTEATIGCTMFQRVPKNGKPSNIGPQYDNVGSFVLKPGTEIPVLRGGIGELCVSGKLIGKGYLNRPDLTKEKFPTLKSFSERVYRTGDLVRILNDGCFIFLGRADDQVKLRGQRLELSEINELIKKSSCELQEVITLVLKHATQQKEQLVSFFVKSSAEEGDGSLISVMRYACKSRLPGYMVPTHFIPIKALPLNANNKADSKQLAAMYNNLTVDSLQKLSQSSQKDKEWTESEQAVVLILAEAMQVEQSALTRTSSIFELGLDSISIIGFSRALQYAGFENAKLCVVRNKPSVGGLVKVLLKGATPDQGRENAYIAAAQEMVAFSQRHMVDVCAELGIESLDVETITPCTPVQEGMIYRFLESEDPLYFNKFEFCLDELVEADKLLNAWNRVIARLQVLRTKFVSTDDGYAQVVLKSGHVSWDGPVIDYDTVEKSLSLRTPYALRLSSGNLTLRIFHGLYDGNSLTMLLHRVIDEYHELETIEYGPSFTTSLPYGPLANVPRAREFWSSHLQNWSPQPMSIVSDSTDDIIASSIITDLTGFESLRKNLGVTPQAVIQATWVSVLQTMLSPKITIGIVTSGRAIDLEAADKVIGPLFNTVPFHINIETGTSSGKLIEKCHEFNMQMQDFQHTPLKDIQKWSGAKIGQSLFDTLFVFQRPGAEDESFSRGVWTEIEGGQVVDYPLAFEANLSPDSGELVLTIVAQRSVITQTKAEELLEQVRQTLIDSIRTSGTNIIFQHGDIRLENEANGHVVAQEAEQKRLSESFTWTTEASKIRQEIASLAKVSEETIHENSSIFELGLDSIDVIKLSSRLKKRGIELSVSGIIKSQSIKKMTLHISAKDNMPRRQDGKSLDAMSRDLSSYLLQTGRLPRGLVNVFPATPLQQSMVNEMIKSGYQRYFNIDAVELAKTVDPEKLMRAVQQVIEQSPILRTTFVAIEDPKLPFSYAQIIREKFDFSTENFGLMLLEEQSWEEFMDSFRIRARSLAVKQQELLQLQFVTTPSACYLAIAISHALYDGTSLRAIHEDIQRAYRGALKSRPDFKPFLEEVFLSTTEGAKKFWRTALSNLPPSTFPRKRLADNEDCSLSTRLERRSRVPLQKIEQLCKVSRITLQTLGQTCWALVLSHLMGQLDVVFGSVLSCRDSDEANEVMFPLMNTVAVRCVLHGSLVDMLKYMQEMSDTTRQYQHFPLGTAQAYALASRIDQASTDNALFDTLFIYQGRRATTGDGQLYKSVYGASEVEFPVCVEMEIVDDEYLSWTTACKSNGRNPAETSEIIDALETVLEHIIANPEAQTISTNSKGISVCSLPKFKKSETKPKEYPTQLAAGVNDEWSATEIVIRKALHDISDVPEDAIRKDSTIFHLGLDSILVLKLPALLKTHGIKLSLSDILREQTVYAMAKAAFGPGSEMNDTLDIDSIITTSLTKDKISIQLEELQNESGEIAYVMPATAGEMYMIRQWQTSLGAMFYQTFTYSLPGPINKKNLQTAWSKLLRRHDILRTGFVEVSTNILQVVFKDPPDRVIYDINKSGGLKILKNRKDLKFPPLDLVVEDAEGPHATVRIVLHHALYDGISLPILIKEFQALYQGRTLSDPAHGFKKFVAQSISASSRESMEEKWKAYLSHVTLYPTYSNQSGTDTANGKKRTEVFHPLNRISNVKQIAQGTGVSIDALFLAAVSKIYASKLLSSTVGQVVFGIYLANRAPFGEDLSNLTAPTLNLLPLRVQNPLSTTISELAKDIQKDIATISGKEMVSASLTEIYEWTGVRVNFFVNILKSVNPSTKPTLQIEPNEEWIAVQGFGKRAKVMDENFNTELEPVKDGKCDAYLPSVDLEFRYHAEENKLDMGVFAPNEMVSVEEAEGMIRQFVAFWE